MLEFIDGTGLIGCFTEREIPQKFAVKRGIYLHRLSLVNASLSVKFKDLCRNFLYLALHSRHRLLPERRADRTYLRENAFLPTVAVNVVHVVDRDVDPVVILVAQGKTVGPVHDGSPFVNSDPKLVVDNHFSRFQ